MKKRLAALLSLLFVLFLIASMGTPSVLAGNTDTPLHEDLAYGLCSDTEAYQVKVAGVGMGGTSSGTIALTLPGTATVEKALLYWTGRDPFDGGDGVIRFEGSLVNGIQTGGPAFWGTNDFAFAYKADVTSMVSPSKTSYSLEDPSTGDSDSFTLPYGAALVVIYKDSSISSSTLVETWEGMDIALGDTSPSGSEGTSPVVFQFDPAALPRSASFTTIVGGIATGTSATLYYVSGSGTPPSTNSDIFSLPGVNTESLPAAQDGSFMTTYDKSITIPADHTWLAVQVRSGTAQIHWLAETLQMEAACPKLQVAKTLSSPTSGLAHVNDPVSFDITITNTGNTALVSVPVTDTFNSTYLSFTSANVSPDHTATGSVAWDDITTALGDLNPGDSKTIHITFQALTGTQSLSGDVTTNTATVSGARDQNNKTAPDDSDDADVEISNPSFTIEKTRISPAAPDDVVTVGENVVYQIVIQNTGDTALTTVPLQDTFDGTKLSFVSASLDGTPTTPDAQTSSSLTWNDLTGAGVLAPAGSLTLRVTLRANASTGGASTTNTAIANGVTDENNETLPQQNSTADVRITSPAVEISKTLVGTDTTIPLHDQVTYSITITNTGDTVLDVVPLEDTFPTAYLDYSSATITPSSVDEGAGKIQWSDVTGASSLNPGDTVTVEVTFDVTASSNPTTITNLACVKNAEDEHGDNPADVCDDTDIITTNPQVTITKTLVSATPVLVGDAIQFQIVVKNTGDTAIVSLPLSDTFDTDKLTYVSASPGPDGTGAGTLTWNDLTGSGSLAVGSAVTVTVNFTAKASTTPATTVNTATVSNATDENGDNVPGVSDTAEVEILAPASIGDKVWVDTNGNGVQDAGESGKDGVVVQLYNSSDVLVASQTTTGGGSYLFEHLFPGDYYIKVIAPSGYSLTAQNQGTDDTKDSDADPATGKMSVTTLSEGENDLSWDAGLYQPAALGDFVWEDVNGNGLQDAGEAGVENVTVKLHYAGPDGDFGTPGDNQVFSTQTNSNGIYSFSSLAPGTYYLEFIAPTGWKITLQDQGADDNADSDPGRTTGMTSHITLISGQTDLSWDAGLYRPTSIGDFTWIDSNANGVYDGGESPLPNVTLTLYDSSHNVITTTTSDGSGIYTFDDLLPGTYTVEATTPAGYVATTSLSQSRTLESGDAVTDADFGFISPTAVSIASFDAAVKQDGVHLTWRTMDESGVTQFRVQRATVQYGPWQDISIIEASGNPGGATYSVVDHSVQPGFTYYYRIVASPSGNVLGPWSVYVPKTWEPGGGIQGGHRTFLPLVSQ